MFLALKEMRRALVRFGLLVAAIGLLVFLILFQQALSDALITSFVGGVRNQSAPVLVYSVDAQRTLQGSVMPPPLEEQVRAVEGVGEAARVGQGTFTATLADGDGEQIDVAVLGTDDNSVFRPTELVEGRHVEAEGEGVASSLDFSVGDVVEVIPSRGADPVQIEVVGLARDIQLSVTASIFTDSATYEAASKAVNPDAGEILPNALAVVPAGGSSVEALVAAVNEQVPDAEALTRDDAADKSPGVAQVRQSFQVIFALYALVAPLVTGLFFLIVTLQKAGSLTLLRAVGATSGSLAKTILVQVVVVIAGGLLVGAALYYPVSRLEVGSLALRFDFRTLAMWSVLLLVLGVISAGASLRRVLQIDPVEATAGPEVR